MELHISEIPSPPETNTNYWSQTKPKFSYDNILSSLNMVVDEKGVLAIRRPNQLQTNQLQTNQLQTQQLQTKQTPQVPTPLPNQVKNSYIFNKYFKDYKDPSIVAEPPRIPQTREEYNQMVLEERIRRINERKRIQQIKSKKLLFDTSGINTSQRVGFHTHLFHL